MAKFKQYVKVPAEIFTGQVSHLAVRVYLVLQKYTYGKETCFPSQRTIASEAGSNPRDVRKALKELTEANFIGIKSGAGRHSSTYTIFFNRKIVGTIAPLREGYIPAHSGHMPHPAWGNGEAARSTTNISTNNELEAISPLIENDSEAATAASSQEDGYMSLRSETVEEAGIRFWLRMRPEAEARYISRVELSDGVLGIKSLKPLDSVPLGWLEFIRLRYPEIAEMRIL